MKDHAMNTLLEKKSTWWSEPMVWLIIVLPVTAVIASITTYWLASSNADTLVTEQYVKEGFAVRQVADRDLKAAELGVGATLNAEPGRLTVDLEGRFEVLPRNLVLTLAHPSDPNMDMVLLLEPAGESTYTTVYATIPAGKRHLELTPGDKAWRITGQWQAPFSGSTRLVASTQFSTQHSSTRP